MRGVAPDRGDALSPESRARGLRGAATAGAGYFPPPEVYAASRVGLRLCIAKQNSRRPPSSAYAPAARGAAPVRLPSGDRLAGRDGRGQS